MPKLSPIKWKEFVQRFRTLGFEGPFSGGKHPYMIKDNLVLRIPNPHRQEIGPDLLSRILRQAKVSRREWEQTKVQ